MAAKKTSGTGKRRPFTLDDRINIQAGLNNGQSIAEIADAIDRTPQTVTAEIKRNRTEDTRSFRTARRRNICTWKKVCEKRDVCGTGCGQKRGCKACLDFKCNENCPEFETRPCEKLSGAPHCCNSCPDLRSGQCEHPYLVYDAKIADKTAKKRISDSRKGTRLSPEEIERNNEIAKEGLRTGKSPAHILRGSPEMKMSLQTFYNHVNDGIYRDVCRADLPRAMSRKAKSKAPGSYRAEEVPREMIKGRTFDAWKKLPEDERAATIEMDTVVGRRTDKKSILSLYWPGFRFQLYFLLHEHTSDAVVGVFDMIQNAIGPEEFRRIIRVIKTDRGAEFSDPLRIERDAEGNKRCNVYYCDPYKSQQKGGAERNHSELRRILPKKGCSDFDALTERDMSLIASHVNSVPRSSLCGATPISLVKTPLEPLLEVLGVEEIPVNEVCMNPMLVPHAIVPGKEPGRKVGPKEDR